MEKTVVTKLPAGDIVEIRRLPDGTLEVVQRLLVEPANKEEKVAKKVVSDCQKIVSLDDTFVLIEASELSLNDDFMQYEPETEQEQTFYKSLSEVIIKGVKDFYRPPMDPTLTKSETGICFKEGKKPAVGKSYNWWVDAAKKFNPEMKSRLGTRNEYIAFLGVLIKLLVKEGWSKKRAWNAVCNDSKELGHYQNSKNAKYTLEPTGSRCICGFYDLVNTYKILAEDIEAGGFWLAGGTCYYGSHYNPLADLDHFINRSDDYGLSVGWLVLEA